MNRCITCARPTETLHYGRCPACYVAHLLETEPLPSDLPRLPWWPLVLFVVSLVLGGLLWAL